MLRHRLIFGLLFGALFVAAIALDSWSSQDWPIRPYATPPGTFIALVCILLIPLALREMQQLLQRENITLSMRIIVVASLLCMIWPWVEQASDSIVNKRDELARSALASPSSEVAVEFRTLESSPWFKMARWTRSQKPHYLVPTILSLSLLAAVIMHSRRQKVDGAMANAGATLLAITYLGVLPGFFLPICLTHSAWMLLVIVAVVKSADIGAYAIGRLIGKHKLIPWLSPGKTIEGFIGGLTFSALVALALLRAFSPLQAIIAGIILGAIGQVGDLLESLLKRDAGVKDSGRVPGFGGILDLLDSPLLAAPAAYWLLKLIAHS
ncbi:MAG: phosphatidate cytidylyltransferase [Phycisphaerales bacterium]|nr:phosphatidate cytidylyltransferase [Phycisphaerales bacterium]